MDGPKGKCHSLSNVTWISQPRYPSTLGSWKERPLRAKSGNSNIDRVKKASQRTFVKSVRNLFLRDQTKSLTSDNDNRNLSACGATLMMNLMMNGYCSTVRYNVPSCIYDSSQRVMWFPCQLFEPEMQPYVGNLSRPDVGNGILCIVAHAPCCCSCWSIGFH